MTTRILIFLGHLSLLQLSLAIPYPPTTWDIQANGRNHFSSQPNLGGGRESPGSSYSSTSGAHGVNEAPDGCIGMNGLEALNPVGLGLSSLLGLTGLFDMPFEKQNGFPGSGVFENENPNEKFGSSGGYTTFKIPASEAPNFGYGIDPGHNQGYLRNSYPYVKIEHFK